ncbi:MAG: RICIN domain-containing protein, partial [Cyanobacteria bacterium P01_A01_bin.17]
WNDGDPVQLTDRTDQPSQHWYLVDQGEGNYQIINRASRLSLSGSPGTSDGRLVQLARPTTQAPQLWRFGS